MNTKILTCIITAAEERSIRKAADIHYLSQPALSEQIHNIEKKYGITIFEREGKGISLTAQGSIFVNTARRILQVEKDTNAKIAALSEDSSVMRIFTEIHLRSHFLDRIWPVFSQSRDCNLSLLSGSTKDGFRCLREYVVDEAFMPVKDALPAGLDAVSFYTDEMLWVIPTGHRAGRSGQICIDALRMEPAYLSNDYNFYPEYQREILEKNHLRPDQITFFRSFAAALDKISQTGSGYSILPRSFLNFHEDSSLQAFSNDPPQLFRITAVYRKESGMTKNQKDLVAIAGMRYMNGTARRD